MIKYLNHNSKNNSNLALVAVQNNVLAYKYLPNHLKKKLKKSYEKSKVYYKNKVKHRI